MRLGDLEALKEEMNKKALDLSSGGMIFIDIINMIIDNAPPVKAFTEEDMAGAYNEGYACGGRENKRPQGEWIHRRIIAKDRSFDMVVCSNCQTEFSWDAETGVSMDNYKTCPNCTADMRKENEA